MVITTVLSALWRMLDVKRRLVLLVLLVSLFIAGCFEMAGMLVIFGFIRGLNVDPETGLRHGLLGKALQFAYGSPVGDTEFAVIGGFIVVSVIAIKNFQSVFVRHQLSRFLSNLNRRITECLFRGFLMAPYLDIRNRSYGRPEEAIDGSMRVVPACFQAMAQILADGATVLMVVAVLFFIDPWLTLGAIFLFGVAGTVLYRSLQERLKQMGREEADARRSTKRFLGESFHALIETRLRDNAGYYISRFRTSVRDGFKTQRERHNLGRIPRAANEILLTIGVTGAVAYMVLMDRDLHSFLPTLAIFGFAGLRANGAMSRIGASLQSLRRNAAEFERQRQTLIQIAPQVFHDDEELDAAPSYLANQAEGATERPLHFREVLEVRDVTFKFPASEEPALDGISLTIKPGSFVAFCGDSGGGKSTLMLLLMGIIQPTSGHISCDGQDIQHHLRAWQGMIGYVGQELYISSTDIRTNVAFGVPVAKIDDAKVVHALRQAAAWDFVCALPRDIYTPLSDQGAQLSGGQKQRIVIARALYHDPAILVLDEATSSVDNATEREITKALQNLRQSKTVLCVAHRLSSIRTCDQIYVLKGGRLVGRGRYEQLLEQNEYFATLANRSAASGESTTDTC